MTTRTRTPARPGFTIVELLVAMALCLLIMTMMAYAFQQGMDTFSLMKSTGELQERLRAAEIILRDDLAADHLETDGGPARVSSQRLDRVTPSAMPVGPTEWKPPRRGFFRILQNSALDTTTNGTAPYQYEGKDSDNLRFTRATDHVMQMTIRRPGILPEQAFYAAARPTGPTAQTDWDSQIAPASLAHLVPRPVFPLAATDPDPKFATRWAEVTYFLDTRAATAATSAKTPGGIQTYPLYRRVRVMMHNQVAGTAFGGANYLTPLCKDSTGNNVCGPVEVNNPLNRLGGARLDSAGGMNPSTDTAGTVTGEDILLTNVISFEIKANWEGGSTPPSGFNPEPGYTQAAAKTDAPFDDLPTATVPNTHPYAGKRVFDTWWQDSTSGNQDNWRDSDSNDVAPQFIRMKAVQIKVRVWDAKNQLARQITVIQNL